MDQAWSRKMKIDVIVVLLAFFLFVWPLGSTTIHFFLLPFSSPLRAILAHLLSVSGPSLSGALLPRSLAASKVWFAPISAVKREAFVSPQQESHGALHGGSNQSQKSAVC